MPAALLGVFFAAPLAAQTVDYPEPESRTSIEDWVVECFDEAGGRCQLYQRVLVNQASAIAMVATFAWDPEAGALRTQIAVPLGIDLEAGGSLEIDTGFSATLPVGRCTQQGCLMEGQITGAFFDALRAGTAATLTVVDPAQGDFTIPLSLRGFDEALAEIVPAAALAEDETAEEPQPQPDTTEPAPDDRNGEDEDDSLAPVTGDDEQ